VRVLKGLGMRDSPRRGIRGEGPPSGTCAPVGEGIKGRGRIKSPLPSPIKGEVNWDYLQAGGADREEQG
jgi:hypothetical protein